MRFAWVLAVVAAAGCGGGGGKSGLRIQNKGSDTLVNVAQAWAERYYELNTVRVYVTGGGSGTGIAALINGTVDIANSSREMKDSEIAQAKAKGIEPVEFIVGHDALAIYVHKDNPIPSITLAQLAEIYGDGGKVLKWSDLGVTVPGAHDEGAIVQVSRQNNSGTYEYFREAVLGKRDFRLGTKDMQGSKDVVDMVSRTPGAIGYSGLAYNNPQVRMLKVAKAEGQPAVEASEANALSGSYPIARPLFMYTKGKPEGEVKRYLDWILSDQGQRIIQEMGYSPVRTLGGK